MSEAVENRIRKLLEEAKNKRLIEAEDGDDDDGDNDTKNKKKTGVVKKDENGDDLDEEKNGKGKGKDASTYNGDEDDDDDDDNDVNEAAGDKSGDEANRKLKAKTAGTPKVEGGGDNEDNKKAYTDTGTESETVDPTVTTKKTSADANINKKEKSELKKAKVTEHINALVSGEDDLSENFKTKAATIFETALNMREDEIREALEEDYNEKLNEAIEAKEKALVEKVDGYLDYVVEKWFEENELAVTSGLKNEMLESFVSGMKSLFEEHYIEVPETKVDVFEELEEKYNATKEKLDEAVNKTIEQNREIEAFTRDKIFNEHSKNLTDSQVEKFKELAEDASFEDAESYSEKLKTIRESYFSRKSGSSIINEDVEGLELEETKHTSREMDSVTSAIDRLFVKK